MFLPPVVHASRGRYRFVGFKAMLVNIHPRGLLRAEINYIIHKVCCCVQTGTRALERIDDTRGYVKGNVALVAHEFNHGCAKWSAAICDEFWPAN